VVLSGHDLASVVLDDVLAAVAAEALSQGGVGMEYPNGFGQGVRVFRFDAETALGVFYQLPRIAAWVHGGNHRPGASHDGVNLGGHRVQGDALPEGNQGDVGGGVDVRHVPARLEGDKVDVTQPHLVGPGLKIGLPGAIANDDKGDIVLFSQEGGTLQDVFQVLGVTQVASI